MARAQLSRWFLPGMGLASVGTTVLFIAVDTTGSTLHATLEGGFALTLGLTLLVIGYGWYAQTTLPETEARTVTLWTAAGLGLLLLVNLWFRGVEALLGPAENHFTLVTSLTAGLVGGAVVGIAVARQRREHRTRETNLRTLHEVTRKMVAETDDEAIATLGCDAIDGLLAYPVNALFRHEDGALVPVAHSDGAHAVFETIPALPVDDSIAGAVYRSGERRIYSNVATAPGVYNPGTPVASEAIFPLGEYGVVVIASTEPDAFSPHDRELMQVLAANTAVALERATLESRLREREATLRTQNERLQRFTDLVAHDLRNPLSVAEGWLETARSSGDADAFERVENAHDRMREIITDLLSLADVADDATVPEPVDVATLARAAWATLDAGDATLDVEAVPSLLARESRLQQLLENLLGNAVRHGGPGVTVRVGPTDDGFFVADDGPGIPVEERDDVFEPGYTTHPEGSGFGMVVVEQIVEHNGWSVGVSERASGGTRVEISGVEFVA